MGESLIETLSKQKIKRSIIFYALITCATVAITMVIGSDFLTEMPLFSQFFQKIQSMLEKITSVLRSNPALVLPYIILVAFALQLKRKINNAKKKDEAIALYCKPKKITKIENPVQQRLKIVATAPAQYFSDLIKRVYTEVSEVYGNIPLWVRYHMNMINHSWSLNDVKAIHNIHVYGEDTYVKAFLARMGEELQILQKDASRNIVNIHLIEPEVNLSKMNEISHEGQPYPKEIGSVAKKWDHTSWLSGLGLFAVALLTLFAFNNWKKTGRSYNGHSMTSDGEALQIALKTIKRLGVGNQELKAQKASDDGWAFEFTDYEIFVNRQGVVTQIRRIDR